ncbi:MAG: diguanylate cyclase [Alteromonadaceae bacterium TMED7]|jgi:diguanylate cyclase (GGDEF)-like protein|uniref:diguanylate cyclase n=1 Tax=uncultured Alteromonas sp. TaxID=179113 RepID=UPI000B6FC592|nr:diguanylate cyclase [uncultured Alteromonas sp.]MCP4866372.1 diguanylate cyclase [Alteromonas sp.]RPH20535.1 MAG: diguanylate cyclase [Alteromonadaceae bacterium TMED7]|tara:strand:- start:15053 stop:17164 length:2112 start_codon:yes stop_codon:yes gene_type:complete
MSFRNTLRWLGCVLWVTIVSPANAQSPPQLSESVEDVTSQIVDARIEGKMRRADELAEQFINQARARNDAGLEGQALYQQARNAMERNRYDLAQSKLIEAIERFKRVDDQPRLGKAYRQMGLTYRYQSGYSQALQYVYLSMQVFQKIGDKDAISSAYNSIGVVLEKMGYYEEALEAHQQALEMNTVLDDKSGVASALYNIGDLRRVMGDLDTALTYFENALELDVASGDPKNIAYSNNKIGYLLNALGQQERARTHILKALELFRKIQAPRDIDWALSSLAQLEMDSGNLAKSKTLIDGVIERAIKNGYRSLLVDSYEIAAELAYRQADYASALSFIEAGLEQARQNNERAEESDFEALRVKVHLANNSLEQAFEALQRQKRLDDQRLNEARLEGITKVQAQAEFVRRAHQIELLEKEQALEQTSRILWMTATFTIVCVCLLLLLLYGRLIQRRINGQLEQKVAQRTLELEEKNQQLSAAYQEVEAISLTDNLTGLHNRRFLKNHIEPDFEHVLRIYYDWHVGKSVKPVHADVVMFIIDLDDFKKVNDSYGHNVGDSILVELARLMKKVFRQSDYMVRWGGEEFVAVARFINREEAALLAQRMLEIINTHHFIVSDTLTLQQTCSIGYVCFPPVLQAPEMNISFKALMAIADSCLYAAKAAGKNSWVGVESAQDPALFEDEASLPPIESLLDNEQVVIRRAGG